MFDVRPEGPPIRTLPIGAVVDLLPVTHAPERVAEYGERMRQGDAFPPIAVVRIRGRFVVADGHKRLAACRSIGREHVLVEVWPWSRWAQDQWRQAADNVRKNRTILLAAITRPGEAWRLVAATLGHWRRVAVCLLAVVKARTDGR